LAPENAPREAAEEMAHTGATKERTLQHWRDILRDYQDTLGRLDREVQSSQSAQPPEPHS
jgi:hypothetical protein